MNTTFRAQYDALVQAHKNGATLAQLIAGMVRHPDHCAYALFDQDGNHIMITDNDGALPTDVSDICISLFAHDGHVDEYSSQTGDQITQLIDHMKFCGWVEEDGKIKHPECAAYGTWMAAIKGCIEVATGV